MSHTRGVQKVMVTELVIVEPLEVVPVIVKVLVCPAYETVSDPELATAPIPSLIDRLTTS